jgi:hypothetical protein
MPNPGNNSTVQLQDVSDAAATFGDLAPALATGGFSVQPAISIANDVMTAMLLGTGEGHPFNWKWNCLNVAPFYTISLQQDYFIPNLVNLGWLANSWAIDINQTSIPKRKLYQEVARELEVTYDQTGYPGKICWMQNDQLQHGTWGQSQLLSASGLNNPGPGVVYTNPAGAPQNPSNPTTCIADAFGNLWVVTFTPGQVTAICGNTNPFLTNTTGPAGGPPVYPIYQAGQPSTSSTVATTVADGTVVWTAINPKGQGFRLNPIPPQTGVVWLINPVGQMRVPRFNSMTQTLEPIPDDWETYFKQGFFAQCYRRSPDPKVRAKFKDEWALYMTSLDNATKQGQREPDDFGFYPGAPGVMDTGWCANPTRPDWPFGPWCG